MANYLAEHGDSSRINQHVESSPAQQQNQESTCDILDWFPLALDLHTNAQSSVDVLSDDKIESDNLHLDLGLVSIVELLQATAGEFRFATTKKKISLTINIQSETQKGITSCLREVRGLGRGVAGDEVRLQQVIRNLLSNAIKFTTPGGLVTVDVSWMPPAAPFGKEEIMKHTTFNNTSDRLVLPKILPRSI